MDVDGVPIGDGFADDHAEAVQDVARAEAAVAMAQGEHDIARRALATAETKLRRAESIRETARSYYHDLTSPKRQRSAITS